MDARPQNMDFSFVSTSILRKSQRASNGSTANLQSNLNGSANGIMTVTKCAKPSPYAAMGKEMEQVSYLLTEGDHYDRQKSNNPIFNTLTQSRRSQPSLTANGSCGTGTMSTTRFKSSQSINHEYRQKMDSINFEKLQQRFETCSKRVTRLNRSKHSTVDEYKEASTVLLLLVSECLSVHKSFEERERRMLKLNEQLSA